jgi:predicted ATPase
MLRRIYVHNYRTFVSFEWRPPLACVLVGDNGSGKSALLDVSWPEPKASTRRSR